MNTFVRYKKEKSLMKKKENTFLKKYLIFFLISVTVLLGVFLLLKKTIWSDSRYVSSILYDKQSVSQVSNNSMYDTLTKIFHWQNIYALRYLKKNEFIKKIREHYPIIKSFHVKDFLAWQLTVSLEFFQPKLRLSNNYYQWGVYSNHLQFITSGDTLWTWTDVIYLPDYLSGHTNLSGIFFATDSDKLTSFHQKIWETMKYTDNFFYIPWWEKFVVQQGDKHIYFNLLTDLELQLQKLFTLQRYYTGYNALTKIDLWSSSELIIQ